MWEIASSWKENLFKPGGKKLAHPFERFKSPWTVFRAMRRQRWDGCGHRHDLFLQNSQGGISGSSLRESAGGLPSTQHQP